MFNFSVREDVFNFVEKMEFGKKEKIVVFSLCCFPTFLFAQKKPNVVIILADDMGYGDVSCNNPYARTETPAIDRLAAAGLRFTDAHSAGALSGPSRYGLVTGRYFFRAPKCKEYWGYLPPYIEEGRMTIGSLMQQAGYTTGCIGKWHIGLTWQMQDTTKPHILTPKKLSYTNTDFSRPVKDTPADRGFDYSFILPASLDMPPYVFVRNHDVVDPHVMLTADAYPHQLPGTEFAWDRKYTQTDDIYWERGVWWRNGEMARSFKFEDCLSTVVEEGVAFIDRAGKSGQPFFLYLPLTGPHTPWMVSEENKGSTTLGTYGDFMKDIDDAVARVEAKLKEIGEEKNTILIFASDNGGAWEQEDVLRYGHASNWGRRGEKGDAWDGGHHVPLIVKWPGKFKKACVSSRTVGLIDLLATLADLTGQVLPEGQAEDSFSFLPILNGNMHAVTRDHLIYLSGSGKLAIKKGDWKYTDGLGSCGFTSPAQVKPVPNGPTGQLYRLSTDSLETNNLFLQHPEQVKALQAYLQQMVEQGHSRIYGVSE